MLPAGTLFADDSPSLLADCESDSLVGTFPRIPVQLASQSDRSDCSESLAACYRLPSHTTDFLTTLNTLPMCELSGKH